MKKIDAALLALAAFGVGFAVRELLTDDEGGCVAIKRIKKKGKCAATKLRKLARRKDAVIESETADGTLHTAEDTEDTASDTVMDYNEEEKEKIARITETAESFGVTMSKPIRVVRGPVFSRYELTADSVDDRRRLRDLIDDFCLNLAECIRMPPERGGNIVALEVPNHERQSVRREHLRPVDGYCAADHPLEVPIGVGCGDEVVLCDLAKAPHVLLAGCTASGKSVLQNLMLVELMEKNPPERLRVVLIDPKQVEFSAYADVPHLLVPVITDNRRAVATLQALVEEMERRYDLLQGAGACNIDGYNQSVEEQERIPYIVVVIDELADLKMFSITDDVDRYICRLAQKSRAAGIHLIIGTQRPTVDVITGTLKCNIPTRIAFKTVQSCDSRAILDMNGAEQLLGRGDMLYMTPASLEAIRLQVPYIGDDEVERVTEKLRKGTACYDAAIMESVNRLLEQELPADEPEEEWDEDPMFTEAAELVVETQKVSTSLLQRRLVIGYSRAAKIVDRMEELGYIGAYEGNKPRRVLITAEQWKEIKKN